MFKTPKKSKNNRGKGKAVADEGLLPANADPRQVNSNPARAVELSDIEHGQTAAPKVVKVVDVSGSMQNNNAIKHARTEAASLLKTYPGARVITFGSHDDKDNIDRVPTGAMNRVYNPRIRGYDWQIEMHDQVVRENPRVITDLGQLDKAIVAYGGTDPTRILNLISGPRPQIVIFVLDGAFTSTQEDYVRSLAEYRAHPAGPDRDAWWRQRIEDNGQRGWTEVARRLVDSGILRETTHLVFAFPRHTKDVDRRRLLDLITDLLRKAGIGAKIVIEDVISGLVDKVKEMTRVRRKFARPLPEGYRRVIDQLGFHPKLTPETLGHHMANHHPLKWNELREELLRLAAQSPELLLPEADPVWAKIHKAMVVSSGAAEKKLDTMQGEGDEPPVGVSPVELELLQDLANYRQSMAEAKRAFPAGTRQRQALDTLYTLSYRNPEKIQILLVRFGRYAKAIVGYLVHVDPSQTTEAEIIDLGRQRTRITRLVERLRAGGQWRFVRRNAEELTLSENGTFIGMPIIDYPALVALITDDPEFEGDASSRASAFCRDMFSLMFIQWTPVPLDGILQWVVALSFIVKCDTPMEPEIVAMIKATFFNDEAHTLDMLGLSVAPDDEGVLQPVIDTDRRELLYFFAILKMVVEVLEEHRDELFPNILRPRKEAAPKFVEEVDEETGEVFMVPAPAPPRDPLAVTPEILLQQIDGFRKAPTIFHSLNVIKDLRHAPREITRKVQFIEEDSVGVGVATSLMPGDLVYFSQETNTRWKKQVPWPAIPCIGVVVFAVMVYPSDEGSEPHWHLVINQLDQETPPMLHPGAWFNCYNPDELPPFDDSVQYMVKESKGLAGLGLIKLGGFMLKDGEILRSGISAHIKKVREVAELLQKRVEAGNKEKKGLYSRWPAKHFDTAASQASLLEKVNMIMGGREAQTVMVDLVIDVPFEAILPYLDLPLCDTFRDLIWSGANPSLEELVELASTEVSPRPDEPPVVDYHYQKRPYKTQLEPEELAGFTEQITSEIDRRGENAGSLLRSFREIRCSICFNSFLPAVMERFKGCRHAVCLGCYHGDGSPEDPGLVCEYPVAHAEGTPRPRPLLYGQRPRPQEGRTYAINLPHLCCPECRVPIGGIDQRIDALFERHNNTLPDNQRFRFCEHCTDLFEQDAPECAAAIDAGVDEEDLLYKTCITCRPPAHPPALPPIVVKTCPSCNVDVHKVAGCDHITCQCGEHWCWRCCTGFGKNYNSARDTYAHMHNACRAGQGYGFD